MTSCIRVRDEGVGARVIVNIDGMRHEATRRRPQMQLEGRRFEDERALIGRVERHLDLMRHRRCYGGHGVGDLRDHRAVVVAADDPPDLLMAGDERGEGAVSRRAMLSMWGIPQANGG